MSGVTVDRQSIRRAWREGGHDFWIELRTKSGSGEAFGQAVADVNERFEAEDGVYAQLNTRSASGFVVLVSDVADDAHLDEWLAAFSARLELHGLDGRLGRVREAVGPGWWTLAPRLAEGGYGRFPAMLTGFIAWSFDLDTMTRHPARDGAWHVSEQATERIANHLADWAEPGGPRILLNSSTFMFEVEDDRNVARAISSAALATGMTGVLRHVVGEEHARAACLAPGGETTLQAITPCQGWQELVVELRNAITALPELTDIAFVRPARRVTISWSEVAVEQPLHGIEEWDIRYNKHLLRDYAPDAHGVQVLRDAHLARAHDLSQWVITDLGDGRHLVEARDLAPWYSTPLPAPAVVNQARHDFGPMLITKEVIAANPPPWL